MNVNSTMPTHKMKQITMKVLFFAYGASDNSMTGFVPHLNVYLAAPSFGSPSFRSLSLYTAVCAHSLSLLPIMCRLARL